MAMLYPYKLGFGVLPERLKEDFEAKQHEYLVVAGGGGTTGTGIIGREDDPPMAMANILGYIELDTGRKNGTRANIRWDISDEDYKSRSYRQHFEQGIIYRVKGCPPKNRESLHTEFARGCLYVTEVLGAYYAEPYLLGLIEEYNKPVTLHSDVFGDMKLSKQHEWFEGECDWLGVKASVVIFADDKSIDVKEQLKALETFYADRENRDKALREFAAGELTDTANQWLADYNYDAEEKLPPVTAESFARRLRISSVELLGRDHFEVYFEDDDMFAGHTVTVYGSLTEGLKSADLMG